MGRKAQAADRLLPAACGPVMRLQRRRSESALFAPKTSFEYVSAARHLFRCCRNWQPWLEWPGRIALAALATSLIRDGFYHPRFFTFSRRAGANCMEHAAHRFLRRSLTICRLAEKAARRVGEYRIDTSNDPPLE